MKRKNNQIYLSVDYFNFFMMRRVERMKRRNNDIYLRVGWLNFKDDEKVKMNGKDK